jgi:CRP/FNR family transcriptional regulator, cyclic AMP receptor protein
MTASGTFTAGEFMARLRPTDRDELTARSRARRWPAGASLFLEGEQSSTVVVVASGRVKVRGPGALLGELSAIDGLPRSASVAALEPVVAHVMHVEAFREFLDSHAQVAVALLHLVVERLRDADRKRAEFAAYDTSARVAQRIVELAERFGEPDAQGTRITVALSQDELAGWVGASREAVAKALRVLREQGQLATGRRTMTVLDLDGLRRRAGRS